MKYPPSCIWDFRNTADDADKLLDKINLAADFVKFQQRRKIKGRLKQHKYLPGKKIRWPEQELRNHEKMSGHKQEM